MQIHILMLFHIIVPNNVYVYDVFGEVMGDVGLYTKTSDDVHVEMTSDDVHVETYNDCLVFFGRAEIFVGCEHNEEAANLAADGWATRHDQANVVSPHT